MKVGILPCSRKTNITTNHGMNHIPVFAGNVSRKSRDVVLKGIQISVAF